MVAIPIALAAAGTVGAVIGLNELAHKDYLPEKIATLAHLVYATVVEVFAFIGCIVAHLLLPVMALSDRLGLSNWLVSWSEKPIDDKAIILVHGYLHNATAFVFLKPFLHLAGYRHVYTINLFPPVGRSIDDYAKALEEKVTEIAKETGCKEITAIGHSMGGLVSTRAALNLAKKPDAPARITRVASLGSPFNGAFAAWIGALFGKNARDMLPKSDFTQLLQKDLKSDLSAGMDFLEIGSHMDELVSIRSSCLTRDPDMASIKREPFEVKDLGHVSLLYSLTIARKIVEWLNGSDDSAINV